MCDKLTNLNLLTIFDKVPLRNVHMLNQTLPVGIKFTRLAVAKMFSGNLMAADNKMRTYDKYDIISKSNPS